MIGWTVTGKVRVGRTRANETSFDKTGTGLKVKRLFHGLWFALSCSCSCGSVASVGAVFVAKYTFLVAAACGDR